MPLLLWVEESKEVIRKKNLKKFKNENLYKKGEYIAGPTTETNFFKLHRS